MAVVTMKQLLESGVHFGHQTRRWNPKMKRYILTERNGIYIIDLQQSLSYIDRAYEFVRSTVAAGGAMLFVGTKKQAQEAIAEQATRVGMPYVNQRWLGGMLTNFQTVNKRLQRLKELELLDFDDVAASGVTKKELLQKRREHDKLLKTLGGIRDMARVPAAVWIVDTKKEHLAVDEARKLKLPIIGILDTNCDPDEVDFPIPGNDDAIRSVGLLTRVVADAVADGLMSRCGQGAAAAGEELGVEEPMAAWERELLESQHRGRRREAGRGAAAGRRGHRGAGRRGRRPQRRRRPQRPPAAEAAPAAEAPLAEAPVAEADRRLRPRPAEVPSRGLPVRAVRLRPAAEAPEAGSPSGRRRAEGPARPRSPAPHQVRDERTRNGELHRR